jgi:hypothetical protein
MRELCRFFAAFRWGLSRRKYLDARAFRSPRKNFILQIDLARGKICVACKFFSG